MLTGIFFDAGGIFYKREESTRHFALRLEIEQGFSSLISMNHERH
jgi:hypothetical protein